MVDRGVIKQCCICIQPSIVRIDALRVLYMSEQVIIMIAVETELNIDTRLSAESLTILQVIFINRLSASIANDSIKDPSDVLTTGATAQFQGKLLELVTSAFSSALSPMFYSPLSLCLCMVGLAVGNQMEDFEAGLIALTYAFSSLTPRRDTSDAPHGFNSILANRDQNM